MVKIYSYLLLTVFLICSLPVAKADDAPLILTAQGVNPINNKSIRLVRERVDINLFADAMGGYADVKAALTFKNMGKEQKVLMGFPAGTIDKEKNEIEKFSTNINGQKLPIKYYKQGDNAWHCWDVSFASGEEKTIISNYKYQDGFAAMQMMFFYPLETGRYWKGNIGEAIINLHLKGIEVRELRTVLPGNFKVTGENNVVWKFKDFEPDELSNIKIFYVIPQDSKQPDNSCKLMEKKGDLESALKCYESIQPISDAKIWSEFSKYQNWMARETFEWRILNYSRNMGAVKYGEYKVQQLRKKMKKHKK